VNTERIFRRRASASPTSGFGAIRQRHDHPDIEANSSARFTPILAVPESSQAAYFTDNGNGTFCVSTEAGGPQLDRDCPIFAVLLASPALAQRYQWTNFAGLPGGAGNAARFSLPSSVAADAGGNFYVTNSGNSTIRKIAPARVVATPAGSAGQTGTSKVTGSVALFHSPEGIAADSSDVIYVADTPNQTIHAITPAGVVTTFAGSVDNIGGADGAGSAAQFNYPKIRS
jgi:hypothetical protein